MSAVTSRADIRRFMATLALAYRRILEATRFFLRPRQTLCYLQIDSGMLWFSLQALGRQKCEKCRWYLANLQRLGTPRKPPDWNRSPAPRPPISTSAVAPARDHGEKLPIGDCCEHAPRRGILDCARLGDENDWPSHGQPSWLWCRAIA